MNAENRCRNVDVMLLLSGLILLSLLQRYCKTLKFRCTIFANNSILFATIILKAARSDHLIGNFILFLSKKSYFNEYSLRNSIFITIFVLT